MESDQNSQESNQGDPSSSTRINAPQDNGDVADLDHLDIESLYHGTGGDPNRALANFRRRKGNVTALINYCRRQRQNQSTSTGHLDPYLPLYRAALKGDWREAKRFLDNDRSAASAIITDFAMTALHVAAFEGHSKFVENIVRFMQPNDLVLQDNFGRTALHYTAITGRLSAAKALVQKNPALTNIMDKKGCTPLLHAALLCSENKDLVWYLSLVTEDKEPSRPFTGSESESLYTALTSSGRLDVLLYLINRYPGITAAVKTSHLRTMAQTPYNFLSGSRLGFWETCVYSLIPVPSNVENPNEGPQNISGISSTPNHHADPVLCCSQFLQRLLFDALRQIAPRCIKRLQETKLRHHCAVKLVKRFCTEVRDPIILRRAAKEGIVEILRIYLQFCPDRIWESPTENDIILTAIEYRQEKIFDLFCEKNARNKLNFNNLIYNSDSVLHLAARLAPFCQLSSVSGAALQMQKELQWFKAVEKLIHPGFMEYQNEDGKTARELFTLEHKALAEAGEKWMKDTSNSCTIVSTLIATFVFAAAFSVPGGTNDDGIPNFLFTNSFMVFAVSDALSLFSSITSLMMFLSILTARYAEKDFLNSLPKRLIRGLACLFFAIATMMMAFGATLYIVLSERLKWISIPITLLTSFPVAIFVLQQLPLFIQMSKSTFGITFRRQSFW